MLRVLRLRAWSVLTACVLCVSTAAATFGSLSHAGADHGRLIAVVEHDAAAHRIQGNVAADTAHPPECLVCQWARSLRLDPGAVSQPAPAVDATLRTHPEPSAVAATACAAQPPLRSPPTA